MLRLMFLGVSLVCDALTFGLICAATPGISIVRVNVIKNAVKIQ